MHANGGVRPYTGIYTYMAVYVYVCLWARARIYKHICAYALVCGLLCQWVVDRSSVVPKWLTAKVSPMLISTCTCYDW